MDIFEWKFIFTVFTKPGTAAKNASLGSWQGCMFDSCQGPKVAFFAAVPGEV
jgi:hypothetical protein